MGMILECPHCYMRVVPKSDGLCPSCHQDPHDLAGTNPDLARVTLQDTDRMPECCMICGLSTSRMVVVEQSRGDDRRSSIFLSMLGLMMTLLAGLGFIKMGHHGEFISTTVPVCESCGQAPSPQRVSFEQSTMTFLVHRRFKNAFDLGNPS